MPDKAPSSTQPDADAMKQIFISHASQDSEVSTKICSILERKGISCWIAPRDVRPGQDYGGEIIRGISEGCDFFRCF